jgi:serine/threonine protein kinase
LVGDLGIAKSIGGSGITRPRFTPPIREPAYMAPEQTRAQADKRTDIYGLGATLYAMLTGLPPYTDRTLVQLSLSIETGQYRPIAQMQPGVPDAVISLVSQCMARVPSDRPRSVGRLVRAIESLPGVRIAGREELCDALQGLFFDGGEPSPRAALVSERGTRYPLQVGNNLVGRRDPRRAIEPRVDLTQEQNAKTVHRAHARVYPVNDRWIIAVDRQSVNRTLINGTRLCPGEKRPLANGDQIELGAVKLVLQISS